MAWPILVSPLGPVQVGTLLWRRKGRIRVTAFVKATFAMIHGGFCLPVDPRPLSTSEQPFFDVPGATPEAFVETWPELMRPEVVLTGNAVAPNREPVRALAVRLVMWKGKPRVDKTVHVLGPRKEARFLPTPFSTLPLVWERTTRGSNGTNPVGVKDDRLPNLVHPRKPTEPACFAARAVGWPGRELPWDAHQTFPPAGVWDWRDEVSVEAFGSAAPDQRLDVLDGDEWIILDGVHAELPRFATRLPMPVATAYLRDEAARRETIPIVLDTVSIDAANLQVSLLWRGSVPLLREHWTDLVVEADLDLGDPDPLDQPHIAAPVGVSLGRGLRLKSDPPSSVGRHVEVVVSPPMGAPPMPTGLAPPGPAALPNPTGRHALPPLQGVPAHVNPHAFERTEAGIGGPGGGPQTLRALTEEPTRSESSPFTQALPAPTAAPANAASPGPLSPTEAAPPQQTPPPANRAAPSFDPDQTQTGLRGTLVARLATKQPLTDLNLTGADLSQLDLSEATLSGLNLSGARLTGSTLRGARLSNAKLAGADLSQADLSMADLTQADLSRATLIDTSFEGAQLLDANISGGEGKRVNFERARAQRAILAQGKWSDSTFVDADLAGADLSGSELSSARLDGANLTGARLVDTRATGLSARGAKLSDANLAGATFIDCDFTAIEAPRTVWDRAVVDGSIFRDAKLDAAGFARAHLDRAQFVCATLVKASLMGVTGEGASFEEANLEAVDLRQGKLMDSNFDRARLCKINALKASFAGAGMSGADLSGASLRSAKLRGANLRNAVLREADLRDADLEQADLRNADKQGAKLAGASLKGAQEGEST